VFELEIATKFHKAYKFLKQKVHNCWSSYQKSTRETVEFSWSIALTPSGICQLGS